MIKIKSIRFQYEKQYHNIRKVVDIGGTVISLFGEKSKAKEPVYWVRENNKNYEITQSVLLDKLSFSEKAGIFDIYRFLEINPNDNEVYVKCGFFNEEKNIEQYFSSQGKMDFWIEMNKENLNKESYELYLIHKQKIKTK